MHFLVIALALLDGLRGPRKLRAAAGKRIDFGNHP
jgi:hypothetical protein